MSQETISGNDQRKVERFLNTKFAVWRKDRSFFIDATVDDSNASVTVTLKNDAKTFVYPVEGRIAHKEQNVTTRDAAIFLLDYIETYFDEYFRQDESVYLPIDWADYECEGVEFQVKGQVLNVFLEEMADQILAQNAAGNQLDAH